MSDFSSNFEALEANVKALIQEKVRLENELKQQLLNQGLKEKELEEARKEIEDLSEKNKILRIAGGAKSGDSREIKLKINEIVREVDKCIAQLNQ